MHRDLLWNNAVQCLRPNPLILTLILTQIARTLIQMLAHLALTILLVEDGIALHRPANAHAMTPVLSRHLVNVHVVTPVLFHHHVNAHVVTPVLFHRLADVCAVIPALFHRLANAYAVIPALFRRLADVYAMIPVPSHLCPVVYAVIPVPFRLRPVVVVDMFTTSKAYIHVIVRYIYILCNDHSNARRVNNVR